MKLRPRALSAFVLLSVVGAPFLGAGCGDTKAGDGIDIDDGSLRGELAIYMSDDLEGRSDTRYALRAPSGLERSLLFDHDVSDLIPGIELKVWGTEVPDGVRVTSYRVVSPPFETKTSALQAGPAFADRAFAFVLVDIGGGVNVTSDVVMGRMVNDANSIRNYYLYDSYGRQNITSQVITGMSFPMTTCDTSGLTRALKPAIMSQFGTFQHYLWYLGSRLSACAWAGLASVGTAARPSADTWYNASTGCVVLVQEPGHNFGMQHSSSIRCTGTPLADDTMSCTASEYGDVFDPMGGGCKHMNAWQKAYQGWFGGCNGVNVTSTGTFTVLPYEMRCDGVQFLQIPAPKTRMIARSGGGGGATTETLTTYFVELRTPLDFDGTLGGGTSLTPRVLLHIANNVRESTQRAIHPYLIDMTPATTSFNDAALAVGQTFTDPGGTGLTITATAVSATQATITVTVPGGTGAPTCLDDTPLAGAGPGPESCIANTAVPTGTPPLPGTGGAPGGGTGGRPTGTGGRAGTGGAGGRVAGTGGTAGPAGTGGAPGTPGTGGSMIIVGTGGTIGDGSGGANPGTAGSIGTGIGGSPARADAAVGIGGNDVSGGCACAIEGGSRSWGGVMALLAVMFVTGRARRRRRP